MIESKSLIHSLWHYSVNWCTKCEIHNSLWLYQIQIDVKKRVSCLPLFTIQFFIAPIFDIKYVYACLYIKCIIFLPKHNRDRLLFTPIKWCGIINNIALVSCMIAYWMDAVCVCVCWLARLPAAARMSEINGWAMYYVDDIFICLI